MPESIVYNMDCMEAMRQMPDKFFDLAVVDPPYGIKTRGHAQDRFRGGRSLELINDAKPNKDYFAELFRVTRNQIIWGYNHLSDMLPSCREFIFWYKHQPVVTFSDGELAWTSFQGTSVCFDYPYYGFVNTEKDKLHPTQKPVLLYAWIFQKYAKPGDKILDTHLGSGSSRIAAYDAGLDFVGFEIDKEYFEKQKERFAAHTAQCSLFS